MFACIFDHLCEACKQYDLFPRLRMSSCGTRRGRQHIYHFYHYFSMFLFYFIVFRFPISIYSLLALEKHKFSMTLIILYLMVRVKHTQASIHVCPEPWPWYWADLTDRFGFFPFLLDLWHATKVFCFVLYCATEWVLIMFGAPPRTHRRGHAPTWTTRRPFLLPPSSVWPAENDENVSASCTSCGSISICIF